jgi:hypothetical protein
MGVPAGSWRIPRAVTGRTDAIPACCKAVSTQVGACRAFEGGEVALREKCHPYSLFQAVLGATPVVGAKRET